jgi:hypothetical protein
MTANAVVAVLAGPAELAGAGDGPAEIAYPAMSWAGPAGGVTTITSGGVAQNLALARTTRTGWLLQNLSNGDLWVDDTNNPSVDASILVPAGTMFVCPENMVTTGILKILGSTANAKFVFRESYQ